ncbi:hypothetical protein ACFLU4_06740 [Chloroflexota bacterium]
MVIKTKTKRGVKIPFKQSEFDRLSLRKAKASLAHKKARRELDGYVKTHTSGIGRLAKGDKWF